MANYQFTRRQHFLPMDPNKLLFADNSPDSSLFVGDTIFTANGAGTTTTLVGANADPSVPTNVVRIGEKAMLYDSTNTLKDYTVFRITAVTVGASTTVTFSPAASGATASGDYFKLVSAQQYSDLSDLDYRLAQLAPTEYTADRLQAMTSREKTFALHTLINGV